MKKKVQELGSCKIQSLEMEHDLDSARFNVRDEVLVSEDDGYNSIEDKRVLTIDLKFKKEETDNWYKASFDFICYDDDVMLEDFETVEDVIEENVRVQFEALKSSWNDKFYNTFASFMNFVNNKV